MKTRSKIGIGLGLTVLALNKLIDISDRKNEEDLEENMEEKEENQENVFEMKL